MVDNKAKKQAAAFRREFGLKDISLESLRNVIEKQGYTIIEFNNFYNDENVTALVDALGLSEMIEHSKGFTYADSNYCLVFLHEGLSEAEKLVVLAHEEGHIYCGHLSSVPIIGKDVREEYEANEFAHFLLNQGTVRRVAKALKQHKPAVVMAVLALVVVLTVTVVISARQNEKHYYGEYYITSTGNKYHEKQCIFVKNKTNVRRITVEEFESGQYSPCATCLP